LQRETSLKGDFHITKVLTGLDPVPPFRIFKVDLDSCE
jgi:hypothetical protein